MTMLRRYGLPSQRELCEEFCRWIDSLPSDFNYIFLANDPRKECNLIPMLSIQDVGLPPWKDRVKLSSHQQTIKAKRYCVNICDKYCGAAMHSSYIPFHRPVCSPSLLTSTQRAKLAYGYHCSLYDAFECYYFQRNNTAVYKNKKSTSTT